MHPSIPNLISSFSLNLTPFSFSSPPSLPVARSIKFCSAIGTKDARRGSLCCESFVLLELLGFPVVGGAVAERLLEVLDEEEDGLNGFVGEKRASISASKIAVSSSGDCREDKER